MNSLRRSMKAAAELGLGPLAAYGVYRLALNTGWLQRQTPALPWEAYELGDLLEPGVPSEPKAYARFRAERMYPRFLFDDARPARHSPSKEARRSADGILRGEFPSAGRRGQGFPPRSWNAVKDEAGNLKRIPADRHWSAYDLGRSGVDARLVWEASRFGWVFPLARAFRATGDRRYADGFWALWESWRKENPPQVGIQWASAQEVGLRLIALAVALEAFAPAWRKDPERLTALVRAILVHARRIPPTLAYARAQGNNHLLSEAAGLYTTGLLLPEVREASRWRHVGRGLFLDGMRSQVFSDGGYVQHSANYHRLALQLGLWTARLGDLNEDPLPEDAVEALARLTLALAALVDGSTGRAVRFGPDDSSDLFPLDPGLRSDFRPTLQAASRLFLGSPLFGPGAWDELSAWLGLMPEARRTPGRRQVRARVEIPASLPKAGLYRLTGRSTWGILRAARFHTRPGHSDQLHLDLWWRGMNLALDPGSFLYQSSEGWGGGLAEADVHNTVTIDGADPMERAGPFLWLDWAQAEVTGPWTSPDGSIQAVAAQHDGYRDVTHRRTVIRAGENAWVVADDVSGAGHHRLALGWNLPDAPWSSKGHTIRLRTSKGQVSLSVEGGDLSVYRAGECVAGQPLAGASARWGWWSPAYGRRQPGLRVIAFAIVPLPMRFISRWILGGRVAPVKLEWRAPGEGPAAISRVRLGRAELRLGDG